MPIPEPRQPDEATKTLAAVAYLINNISGLKAPRPALRMFAFAFDFALLHGLSLCAAQWLSVLMLRQLLSAKGIGNGVVLSAEVFQTAYQYGISLIWPIAMLFLGFSYFVTCIHLWGASIGLGLFGLKVVTRTGEMPSLERAGKRFFASIFTFFSLGFFFFFGAYSRDGICFHDEASGTRVVRRDSIPVTFSLTRETGASARESDHSRAA